MKIVPKSRPVAAKSRNATTNISKTKEDVVKSRASSKKCATDSAHKAQNHSRCEKTPDDTINFEEEKGKLEPASPPTIRIMSPSMKKMETCYISPKVPTKAASTTAALRSSDQLGEIQRIIQESKDREQRIQDQLKSLKEHVKVAMERKEAVVVATPNVVERVVIGIDDSLKKAMNNLLAVTKETRAELKHTKELVSSMREDTQSKISGSFKSIVIEDCDEHIFPAAADSGTGEDEPAIRNHFFICSGKFTSSLPQNSWLRAYN